MTAAVITLAAGYPATIALALVYARAGVVSVRRPAARRDQARKAGATS